MSRGDHRAAERRILQLLHCRRSRTRLTEIHAHFLRRRLDQSNLLLAHFVSVCASLRRMRYAHILFLQTENPNLLLFNAMIKGYSLSAPSSEESLSLFSLMRNCSIYPDEFTFAPLLKSCSNLSNYRLGQGVHAETVLAGFDAHCSVSIGLVELYAGCKQMEDARRVFGTMRHRDVIIWNLMIHGFCRIGDMGSAYQFFHEMSERNVITWNSMIAGLARNGRDSEALKLFREMWDLGFEPDDATLATVLPVCAHLRALDVGRWVHAYADRKGLSKGAINVGNSLVDMYCKCGDLASAQVVFDELPRKSLVSWNVMIMGMAFNGCGRIGIDMFEEMKRGGLEPNAGTFIGVLGCCTHAGLVEKGRELFDSMVLKYGIRPKLEHYGCMVDLLGRCGFVKEALALIRSMPMRPSAAIWGALLSACRIHGDLDVAESVAKELIDLESCNSGNYVLLSNVYAEAGRWDEAEKVRLLMRGKNVQKEPGQSMIEYSH